jgi:predicted molibdopterin-dependent oxidoreductase YjgC
MPGEEAKAFAKDYRDSKTAMIMIDRERASAETARLACELAVICGKIGRPNCGVIQMLQHNNTQTVSLMRIRSNMSRLTDDIKSGRIKGMVLAEQFIPDEEAAGMLEYAVLLDSARGPAFSLADVFLPMPGYGSFEGTYLSAEGRVQKVHQIFSIPAGRDGFKVLDGLIAAAGGEALGSLEGVQRSIAGRFPVYKPALLHGEAFLSGGPVRYREGYATPDKKAHLMPAAGKAPAFGEMCFADVPLCTWFGQLVGEGVLKID